MVTTTHTRSRATAEARDSLDYSMTQRRDERSWCLWCESVAPGIGRVA
jgi:hypothetical protein